MRGSMSYNATKGYILNVKPSKQSSFNVNLNNYSGFNWDSLYEYEYDASNNILKLNGNTIQLSNYEYDTLPNRTMLIGAAQSTYSSNPSVNSNTIANMRIYDWQVWQGETLIQHLIPCYNGTTGYMCDTVSETIKGKWANGPSGNLVYGFD